MSETLVKVEGVSKKFCKSLKKSLIYGMQDIGREVTGRRHGGNGELRHDEFWAVKDVSFELKRGDCLGLLGRNGAGKTTLLRILNGLIKPDAGRIEMRGNVGALIALGAGFNPILTGRENIYVNASVLGISKKNIDAKIDEIIDFAEIGEFIDMPVQSYSSGMQVRLGFAVATSLKPDILILDEVLAVGDAQFRSKCYRRISELQKKAAVIFVSHSMDHIARICSLTLVLSRGEAALLGSVSEGVEAYEQIGSTGVAEDPTFLTLSEPISQFSVDFQDVIIESGNPVEFKIQVFSKARLEPVRIKIFFYNQSGAFAADGIILSDESCIELREGVSIWNLRINTLPLKRGTYKLAFNIFDPHGEIIVWSYKQHEVKVIGSHPGAIADCQLKLTAFTKI